MTIRSRIGYRTPDVVLFAPGLTQHAALPSVWGFLLVFHVKSWLLSILLSLAPLRSGGPQEDAYEQLERYETIAEDIEHVTSAGPWLFSGPQAHERTALMLLAIAHMESGFHFGVDTGAIAGDGGRSVCILQRNVGRGVTPEGWDRVDLIRDRKKCIRSALNLAARCVGMCRGDWIKAYGSGSCARGGKAAAKRWALYYQLRRRWMK